MAAECINPDAKNYVFPTRELLGHRVVAAQEPRALAAKMFGTSGTGEFARRASPRQEDKAAGRANGWKADERDGVRIYPEKMTGLMRDRVIITEPGGLEGINSNYRAGFASGVEALVGLKGVASAGKGHEKAKEGRERGDAGGPLVWDRATALRHSGGNRRSIYGNSYVRHHTPRTDNNHAAAPLAAGKTATEPGEVKTSRCVEVIGSQDWQRLVVSEYQAENDAEAVLRSHRARAKAKELTHEEREARWMKCFAKQMDGEEEEDGVTTTATAASCKTGATEFSMLPSGFLSKRSEEIRAKSQGCGRLRLHMYDEPTAEARKGGAPYATVPAEEAEKLRSIYGGDFVAHLGKAPGKRRRKKPVD